MLRRLIKSPLCWLLLFAFVLRAATVFWGLPRDRFTAFYHADEVKSWGSAVDFPANYLASENYLYGTAVQYTAGILLTPLRLAMDAPDPRQHQRFVVAAVVGFRLFNVLLGTAAIALTYWLARRLFDHATGMIAAGLLSVSTSHVMNSPLCTLDVPMSFLLVAAFLLLDRAFASGRPLHFVQAGLVAGLLLGTKATGVFFLAVPFAMLGLQWWEVRRNPEADLPAGSELLRPVVLNFLPVAGLVFAVTTPHVVLSFGEFLDVMRRQKLQWYDRPTPTIVETLSVQARAVSDTVGPVAGLLAVWTIAVSPFARTQRRLLWSLALFTVGYFLFWKSYLPARFVAFVAPVLCVFAAAGVSALSSQLRIPRQGSVQKSAGKVTAVRRPGVIALVTIAVPSVAVPLWLTAAETRARWHDPRTAAARFLHDEFPAGTTIGIATDSTEYTWRHHQWRYPPVDWTRFLETPFLDGPQVLVVSSIELDLMRSALASEKLQAGFVWDERFRSDWYQLTPPSPDVFRFYEALLHGRSYQPLRRFRVPANPETGGLYPEIVVYLRRASNGTIESP